MGWMRKATRDHAGLPTVVRDEWGQHSRAVFPLLGLWSALFVMPEAGGGRKGKGLPCWFVYCRVFF
jgi:hypothetical protein